MNLVEACKLARTIEGFKSQLGAIITNPNYSTKVTENHLLSKVDSELADKVVERESDRNYDITVEDAIKLLNLLIEKKAILSSAIESAKHDIKINVNGIDLAYDSAIEYNKSLRDTAIYSINRLNRIKDGVATSHAVGYRFNAEGNQTQYTYDMEVKTELITDRKANKKQEKAYRKLADEISTKIDEAKLATKINVDLGIDSNDTFEDIIENLL